MLLRTILLSVLLLEISNFHGTVAKKCQNPLSRCSCREEPEWKAGVLEFYTGCKSASLTFEGSSYDAAAHILNAMDEYYTKLADLSNSNSKILASSATAYLMSTSRCRNVGTNSTLIINEFIKVFPNQIKEFRNIARKLSYVIGERIVNSFNDALVELARALMTFMTNFARCSTPCCRRQLDYTTVLKEHQQFMNTVSLISETLLNKCEGASEEVHEAVTVLLLAFHDVTLSVQGIKTCAEDILYKDDNVSRPCKSCSLPLDHVIGKFGRAINSVALPFNKTIRKLLSNLVSLTLSYNRANSDVLGAFEGVPLTSGEIAESLLRL